MGDSQMAQLADWLGSMAQLIQDLRF